MLPVPGTYIFIRHQRRPPDYNVQDYFNEFGTMVNGIHDDKQIKNANKLVAPSLQGTWKAEDLWATGYLDAYSTSISVVAMEQCVYLRPYHATADDVSPPQLSRPKLRRRVP